MEQNPAIPVDYDALVDEVLDSISAQIDDIVGNYTAGDDKEGDDS